tara:strand:+ start:1228 stop:1620 length:393 start_codon:yes stop_codon:yes gene_type:complete
MKQTEHSISAPQTNDGGLTSAVTGGAILLAGLSASCCILPLALSIVGLGGSWLSFLGPFVRYREIILLVVAVTLVWSWVKLWRSPCGITGNRNNTIFTAIATLVFLGALSAPLWENEVARSLWDVLRNQS